MHSPIVVDHKFTLPFPCSSPQIWKISSAKPLRLFAKRNWDWITDGVREAIWKGIVARRGDREDWSPEVAIWFVVEHSGGVEPYLMKGTFELKRRNPGKLGFA
ncbi:hypothetical protein Droror1_Dr00006408 [Drosera rotundifolia]